MGCSNSISAAVPQKISDLNGLATRGEACKARKDARSFHDRYKLGKKLGEGSFGQVRAGRPVTSNMANQGPDALNLPGEVAVKVIQVSKQMSEEAQDLASQKIVLDLDRLKPSRYEASVGERLGRHPHTVRLYEALLEDGIYYMVMERCSHTLLNFFSSTSYIGEVELKRILREMLLGLSHVHEVGIIHRDVKPDNFLLGGESGSVVKLADFGLSTEMPATGTVRGVVGTAPYMSPELIRDFGYDQRTDVWSFGATAFLILRGTFPYILDSAKPDARAMKKAILHDSPPLILKAEDEPCREDADAVDFLRALLTRSPTSRPTSDEALNLPYLCSEATVVPRESARTLRPQLTRDLQTQKRVDPTVQRGLDELLQQMQVERCRTKERPGDTRLSGSYISERLPPPGTPEEPEGARRSFDRSSTHSGIFTNKIPFELLPGKNFDGICPGDGLVSASTSASGQGSRDSSIDRLGSKRRAFMDIPGAGDSGICDFDDCAWNPDEWRNIN